MASAAASSAAGARGSDYDDRAEAHAKEARRIGAVIDKSRSAMAAVLLAILGTGVALGCGALQGDVDIGQFNAGMAGTDYMTGGGWTSAAAAPGHFHSENGWGLTVSRGENRGVRGGLIVARARARAQVMHFPTEGAIENAQSPIEDVLDLCEPSVLNFVRSIGGIPNMMVDMILRAGRWDSGLKADDIDKQHLKALVNAARDAGALYLLGWGSDVSAMLQCLSHTRPEGRLTRAPRRWRGRCASS